MCRVFVSIWDPLWKAGTSHSDLKLTILSLKSRKKMADKEIESETLAKWYEASLVLRAPRQWAVFKQKISTDPIICKPLITLNGGVWDNRVLYFLRNSLMLLVAAWDKLFPEVPCPIEFSSEEKELHGKEIENTEIVWKVLRSFRWGTLLPIGGMIGPEEHDQAVENSRTLKAAFLTLAKDEEEKELYDKIWPFQASGVWPFQEN